MWPRLSNRRFLLLLILPSCCFVPFLIFFLPNSSPYDVKAHFQNLINPDNSIKCFHYDPQNTETLRDISKYKIRRGKSIFFHETSCRHTRHGHLSLDARQACAVESAARANSNWDIYLTFSSPGLIKSSNSQNDRVLNILQEYDNIKIVHLNYGNYTKDTPLEEIYQSGKLDYSSFPVSHASDILRYITLYKYGGIYLDLDVIVVKTLEDLKPNFAGAETEWNIAAGVLSMDHQGLGHQYAKACMDDLQLHYSAHEWGNNGPMIVTRLLRKLCQVELSKDMMNRTCEEFHVYPPYMFYPVGYADWHLYFDRNSVPKVFRMVKDSYVLHVWNKESAANKLTVNSETAYTIFARKFCPRVFEQCVDYF